MSDLICQIVTRKIYAYAAEIYGSPTFWDGKWCLLVYVLWRNNGCPIREGMVLKFDTKEEAERVKIGTIVKDKTLNNITVYEAMAADAVSYADALIEELDKKK